MIDKTEKEKMLNGEPYRSSDRLLVEERKRAKRLAKAFNDSLPDETEKRAAILRELLGKSGSNLHIEPPFYCDYGYNLVVGDNFYANFNCIMLDCAQVIMGHNVFLGPAVQIYTATHPLVAGDRDTGLEAASKYKSRGVDDEASDTSRYIGSCPGSNVVQRFSDRSWKSLDGGR